MAKNFIQLKQALRDWLGLSTAELSDAIAGDIINIVAREYCRQSESRFGETSDVFRTQVGIRDYTLPEGWSKPRSFWYPSATDQSVVTFVDYIDKDTFDKRFPASGLYGATYQAPVGAGTLGDPNLGDPTVYTVWAGFIQVMKIPNRTFTIYRNYWRIPADLTDAAPTNEFTKQAWEYLLFAGLVKASQFGFEDERVPMWEAQVKTLKADLLIEDARSRSIAEQPVSQEPG